MSRHETHLPGAHDATTLITMSAKTAMTTKTRGDVTFAVLASFAIIAM